MFIYTHSCTRGVILTTTRKYICTNACASTYAHAHGKSRSHKDRHVHKDYCTRADETFKKNMYTCICTHNRNFILCKRNLCKRLKKNV